MGFSKQQLLPHCSGSRNELNLRRIWEIVTVEAVFEMRYPLALKALN